MVEPPSARSYSKHVRDVITLEENRQILHTDVQLHLTELSFEHAKRDANTMLWQAQMKRLEEYVPESGLDDDVLFYGGNMFVCKPH